PTGRCMQLQRGEPSLPDGVPEVDVFVRVLPLEGAFPDYYLSAGDQLDSADMQVGRGVAYTDRSELVIHGLPAVRARFPSSGPTPNWGVEYVLRKAGSVLDAYVSRPSPETEAAFDLVMSTVVW